jgi:hypothetical protein
MTEADWFACEDAGPLLQWLERNGKACERKLRLFACACCRRYWSFLEAPGQTAVSAAERAADGVCTEQELLSARQRLEAELTSPDRPQNLGCYLLWAAYDATFDAVAAEGLEVVKSSSDDTFQTRFVELTDRVGLLVAAAMTGDGFPPEWYRERVLQCSLLRDLIGNPFHPRPTISALVLAWQDQTVVKLAQAISEGGLDRLPILADALEEAGCSDAAILDHCRGPGPHVRGCWVVDLLLSKT